MGLRDDAAFTPVAYGPNAGNLTPPAQAQHFFQEFPGSSVRKCVRCMKLETECDSQLNPMPCSGKPDPHPDILGDVDALHARCEMARRVGFAKAEIREALGFLEGDLKSPYWAEKALRRALQMLETGRAE